MKNLKITKRFTKRASGRETQLIIKRKNDDIEEATEESTKVFNALKNNAPKCLKRGMEDTKENFLSFNK